VGEALCPVLVGGVRRSKRWSRPGGGTDVRSAAPGCAGRPRAPPRIRIGVLTASRAAGLTVFGSRRSR